MESDSILENDDWKLANKLRHEDPEQFYTLVRMHLSFVLDLNTDDCEWPAEKAKLRQVLKWSLAPFSKKTRTATKNNAEGKGTLSKDGIAQVFQLVEFLSKEDNVVQEGIFRRSGKVTRQQELKSMLSNGMILDFDNGQFSVHDCASVLKTFLADLSEPLLTEAYYPAYCQIAELCMSETASESRLQCALQLLLLLLPGENWAVLKNVIKMLQLISTHEPQNKMSAENLATLFTPHLLCPRKLTLEALHSSSQMLSHVVTFMIRSGLDLFQVPPRLATDIFAYWERRKMSPKHEVCGSSAANTVFSFVDRERTAQENTTNPTEAALAQLYAYIQSLPESSKKRRLIKQFNKENGHGTPRPNNRSLGDSIKKRIFSKTHKLTKPLNEHNLLKCGRSSSEEMLDNPEDCQKTGSQAETESKNGNFAGVVSPSKVQETESGTVEVGVDVVKEGDSVTDKKIEIKKKASRALHIVSSTEISENSPSPIAVLRTSYPSDSSPSVEHPPIACTPVAVDADRIVRPIPDGRGTFFTPSTPIGVRHRHWSVSRASSSTPNPTPKQQRNANGMMLLTSTPAPVSGAYTNNNNNCLLTPSPMILSASADDMSPITRSTRRMTRAMQETMMTPRSRKPVVALSGSNISHLANMTWGAKETSWPSSDLQDDKLKPCFEEREDNESLTSPFRDYLLSRSVLTASPVDLSFSSRTGDFDPSSFSDDILPSLLSESLLHCLDGKPVSISSENGDSSGSGNQKRGSSLIDDSDDPILRKRERSSLTSGLSSVVDSSREAVFETSL